MAKRTGIVLICLFIGVCLSNQQFCYADSPQTKVKLETNFGDIVLELYYDDAPITVTNFLKYVNSGFYEGLIFHRVIEGFMIQAGGFDPDLYKKEPTEPPIINESYNGLSNLRDTIAMALTPNEPNSADSQFYINHVDNNSLDRANASDGYGYCVFGRVISDMNVVDAIADVNTGDATSPSPDQGLMKYVPTEPPGPIVINSAEQIFGFAGDIDNDCNVNFYDYAVLSADWLQGEFTEESNRGQTTDVHAERSGFSQNIFVWEDGRDDPNWDIYAYNLATDTEFAVTTAFWPQITPAVSGDIVVWRDYRNYGASGTDIWAADISDINNINEFVVCQAAGSQKTPAVDGNIVVWDDYRDSVHDIYGADISDINDINELVICENNGSQYEPDVGGDIVVWTDERAGNSDIYAYRLSTAEEFPICTDTADQYSPLAAGDMVIWTDERNGGTDIYGTYISGSNDVNEFVIATGIISGYDVGENVVIWQQQRNSQWNIYSMDLSDANNPFEFIVCQADGIQAEPAADDGIAVWRDWRDIEGDLYWKPLCQEYYEADLNYDCVVDINDLAIICENWLQSCP